jgi:AcrR family transcriptional regulator
MARRRNPKGHGDRLRDDLVDAAADILSETGDELGLSLREVARRVGVSSPAVYLHFTDKDELLVAVVTDRFERLGRAIAEAVDAAPDVPGERLRAGCHAYVALALDDPGTYRVLFGGRSAADLGDQVRGRTMAPFQVLVDGIAVAQRQGAVRRGDPTRLAVHTWAALHGIAGLRQARPGFGWPPADELINEMLGALLGLPRASTPASADAASDGATPARPIDRPPSGREHAG